MHYWIKILSKLYFYYCAKRKKASNTNNFIFVSDFNKSTKHRIDRIGIRVFHRTDFSHRNFIHQREMFARQRHVECRKKVEVDIGWTGIAYTRQRLYTNCDEEKKSLWFYQPMSVGITSNYSTGVFLTLDHRYCNGIWLREFKVYFNVLSTDRLCWVGESIHISWIRKNNFTIWVNINISG